MGDVQGCRLRNELYCVEWDVKLYYTIPYPETKPRGLGCESACFRQLSSTLQPPSPFISIIDVREDCVEWWNVILLLHKRVLYARVMHAVFSTAVCITKFY